MTGIFYLFALLMIGSALAGVVVARRGSSIVVAFLLSMISLSGIFAVLDAHLLAVAQLLMSSTLGLLLYFTNGTLLGFRGGATDLPQPSPWRWSVAMAGVGVTGWLGSFLFRVSRNVSQEVGTVSGSLGEPVGLGVLMFGDYAIAVVGIGFLILSALIGAGYLARQGLD